MTLSAAQILEGAGVTTEAPRPWSTLQVAKVHTDLAYRLAAFAGTTYLAFAGTDGATSTEAFSGSYALRSARGRLGRLKRGEETL